LDDAPDRVGADELDERKGLVDGLGRLLGAAALVLVLALGLGLGPLGGLVLGRLVLVGALLVPLALRLVVGAVAPVARAGPGTAALAVLGLAHRLAGLGAPYRRSQQEDPAHARDGLAT